MSTTNLYTSPPGYYERNEDGNWTKPTLLQSNNDWADNILRDSEEIVATQNEHSIQDYYTRYPKFYKNYKR